MNIIFKNMEWMLGEILLKKSIKIFLLLLGMIVLIVGLLSANAMFGNPFSKAMAKGTAQKYIAENYGDTDYAVYDVHYNFKDGYYHARIISPTSIDTHFDVRISYNKVVNDSFEEDVLTGWNTWQRVDDEYRNMVDEVFKADDFPLRSNIDFGEIVFIDEYSSGGLDEANYGMKLAEFELDKIYDVKELAKTSGHIVYYAEDEEVSFTKASELLLILKEELDQAGIPFYAIDFNLEKPRTDDGVVQDDEFTIHTMNFLYGDIYEDGLVERIETAHTELMEYYDELDAQMEKEEEN